MGVIEVINELTYLDIVYTLDMREIKVFAVQGFKL